jgi:hypothetical protein
MLAQPTSSHTPKVRYNNPHGQHLSNQQQEIVPMQQMYYHDTLQNVLPQLTVSNFPHLPPVNHPLTNSSQNNTTTPMQCDLQNKIKQNKTDIPSGYPQLVKTSKNKLTTKFNGNKCEAAREKSEESTRDSRNQ